MDLVCCTYLTAFHGRSPERQALWPFRCGHCRVSLDHCQCEAPDMRGTGVLNSHAVHSAKQSTDASTRSRVHHTPRVPGRVVALVLTSDDVAPSAGDQR